MAYSLGHLMRTYRERLEGISEKLEFIKKVSERVAPLARLVSRLGVLDLAEGYEEVLTDLESHRAFVEDFLEIVAVKRKSYEPKWEEFSMSSLYQNIEKEMEGVEVRDFDKGVIERIVLKIIEKKEESLRRLFQLLDSLEMVEDLYTIALDYEKKELPIRPGINEDEANKFVVMFRRMRIMPLSEVRRHCQRILGIEREPSDEEMSYLGEYLRKKGLEYEEQPHSWVLKG
jgi:preprotein translocase subunit Sss1